MSKTTLIVGDCLKEIRQLEPNSVHAVCTDPPYGLVEFSSEEIAKLRSGRGGVWRIPPKWDRSARRPLPRFTVLTAEQKASIEAFFASGPMLSCPSFGPEAM